MQWAGLQRCYDLARNGTGNQTCLSPGLSPNNLPHCATSSWSSSALQFWERQTSLFWVLTCLHALNSVPWVLKSGDGDVACHCLSVSSACAKCGLGSNWAWAVSMARSLQHELVWPAELEGQPISGDHPPLQCFWPSQLPFVPPSHGWFPFSFLQDP